MSLLIILALAAAAQTQSQQGSSPASQQNPPQRKKLSEANAPSTQAQTRGPIEFESRGMQYEAMTHEGVTVMFAPLPQHIKDYNIIQVTVMNGSPISWTVKPTDFSFVRDDGKVLNPVPADYVVASLLDRAGSNDVIKLQLLYEDSIYALSNYRSTNGYEQRREAALAQGVNKRFAAAAAASAIAFVPVKLKSGESTDGAVFFENRTREKGLGAGRLIAHTCGEIFEFVTYPIFKGH